MLLDAERHKLGEQQIKIINIVTRNTLVLEEHLLIFFI